MPFLQFFFEHFSTFSRFIAFLVNYFCSAFFAVFLFLLSWAFFIVVPFLQFFISVFFSNLRQTATEFP